MNNIKTTLVFLLFHSAFISQNNPGPKKILFVATNIDVVNKNENGSYLVEIAFPFQYFTDKGYSIDIVTPKGDPAPVYPKENSMPALKKIQHSDLFIAKTKNTITPGDVKDTSYAAVFYPGGYGQFFDVVQDERISRLVAKIYERGGIVGASGHGTASLVNIKLSNNKYLVEGKKLTCFPHWFEIQNMWQADYGKLLPFDMQEVLIKRGAGLVVCPGGKKPESDCRKVVDGKNRIVTGAFADDALWVAEQMLLLLQSKAD